MKTLLSTLCANKLKSIGLLLIFVTGFIVGLCVISLIQANDYLDEIDWRVAVAEDLFKDTNEFLTEYDEAFCSSRAEHCTAVADYAFSYIDLFTDIDFNGVSDFEGGDAVIKSYRTLREKIAVIYEMSCKYGDTDGCLNRAQLFMGYNVDKSKNYLKKSCDAESLDHCAYYAEYLSYVGNAGIAENVYKQYCPADVKVDAIAKDSDLADLCFGYAELLYNKKDYESAIHYANKVCATAEYKDWYDCTLIKNAQASLR